MKIYQQGTVLGNIDYVYSLEEHEWIKFDFKRMYISTGEISNDHVYCRSLKDALALVMSWNASDPRWKYWIE